jgi:lipoate-protein ligase B
MGKRGSDSDFLNGVDTALASGIEVSTSPRGGETTYHGPGQLILYPVVNLRELRLGPRAYVETLEDIMIDTAAKFGVKARVCC